MTGLEALGIFLLFIFIGVPVIYVVIRFFVVLVTYIYARIVIDKKIKEKYGDYNNDGS